LGNINTLGHFFGEMGKYNMRTEMFIFYLSFQLCCDVHSTPSPPPPLPPSPPTLTHPLPFHPHPPLPSSPSPEENRKVFENFASLLAAKVNCLLGGGGEGGQAMICFLFVRDKINNTYNEKRTSSLIWLLFRLFSKPNIFFFPKSQLIFSPEFKTHASIFLSRS
jgi:hypothetical protein